uniref:Uncharacterized protein n=1 Tax=Rhizophora mucronata TaxID=61149 RepID=A0A2P2N0N3_RHIMU
MLWIASHSGWLVRKLWNILDAGCTISIGEDEK